MKPLATQFQLTYWSTLHILLHSTILKQWVSYDLGYLINEIIIANRYYEGTLVKEKKMDGQLVHSDPNFFGWKKQEMNKCITMSWTLHKGIIRLSNSGHQNQSFLATWTLGKSSILNLQYQNFKKSTFSLFTINRKKYKEEKKTNQKNT